MKSFIGGGTAAAATLLLLLLSLSPALALPNRNMDRLPSRSASPEPLDLGHLGDAFKDGWGKVQDGFDKVGDWFQDLPDELKELDSVGDDVKKAAKAAWETDLGGGCLIVQCATALAPTALTCVVSSIDGNPFTCIGALASLAVKAPKVCDACRDALGKNIGLQSVGSKCSREQ